MASDKNAQVMDKVKSTIDENSILAELQGEYDVFDMLSYNEYNAVEKIEKNAYYTEQFRLLWTTEKAKLWELNRKYESRRGEIYHYYKVESDLKLNKTEIERYYLPKEEELNELREEIEKQQVRCEFFEALHDAFKTQGWQLKQYIQSLREGL